MSRAAKIEVKITSADGVAKFYINQQQNAGMWNSLVCIILIRASAAVSRGYKNLL